MRYRKDCVVNCCYQRFHFYEKVIKVKPTWRLSLFFSSDIVVDSDGRGELSRAPFSGVHLDQLSTPLHNRARNEAQRSSVELRSLVDGFGFGFSSQGYPPQGSALYCR